MVDKKVDKSKVDGKNMCVIERSSWFGIVIIWRKVMLSDGKIVLMCIFVFNKDC